MIIEAIGLSKMKKSHLIVLAVIVGIGLWWYFSKQAAIPGCLSGTLPLSPNATVTSSVYGGLPTTTG